jgi:hypothetical protein
MLSARQGTPAGEPILLSIASFNTNETIVKLRVSNAKIAAKIQATYPNAKYLHDPWGS